MRRDLPTPGRSEQREQVAGTLRHCRPEVGLETLQFARRADERRIEMPEKRVGGGVDGDEPKRLHRLSLPLQLERLDGVDRDGVSNEREGLGADQDLSGRSRLLESRGHVDRITRNERLALAGYDLARVDPVRNESATESSSPRAVSRSRISATARTARRASSSCATGMPKTAIAASPMNFSIVPPWRSTISRISSK